MSNFLSVGQMFGAAIGLAVGFMFPAVGIPLAMSIGFTVGGIIDPMTQDPIQQALGTRLGDLNTQTSEWGQFIYQLYGQFKISGNVIWSLDLRETKHTQTSGGGKGGGGTKTTSTWYTYSSTWAVAFCEGEIGGISKIWFDSVLVYDGLDYSGGLTLDNYTLYKGTEDQEPDWLIQADRPDTSAYRGTAYIVFNDIQLENYGNKIPKVSCEISSKGEGTGVYTLSSIVRDLLLKSGLSEEEFDVTDGTDLVTGYVIANDAPTRTSISQLISAYGYDLVEANWIIKLEKRREKEPVEIQKENLLEELEITRTQEVDLSDTISISYANKGKNYDAVIQSASRIDSHTDKVSSYQYPMALDDSFAKNIAERYLYLEWSQRLEFILKLPIQYVGLNPLDVIKIDDHLVRITQIDLDSNLTIKGVNEDLNIYDYYATAADIVLEDDKVELKGKTEIVLLDIPMLDNSINYEGIYVAGRGEFSGWNGADISRSSDNGGSWNTVGTLLKPTNIGFATTKLLTGKTTTMDTENSVIIRPRVPLYSISLDVLYNANNYIVLGNEVLQYQTSIENGDGTYTLKNLLRGRRGTEWAVDTHEVGENFVLLNANMIFDRTAAMNVDYQYKGTTFGDFVEDSTAIEITPEIVCLKPLSPSYVKGVRDSSNNITITWMRRSRDVTGYMKALQLFEETESYQIDIAGTTKYSNTQEYYYSAVDQEADGLTLGEPITITVYQISGTVMRGYGTEAII